MLLLTQSIDLGSGVTMEFVLVPPGRFWMGCRGGPQHEEPLNLVRVPGAYWIGRYPVTKRQYDAVTNSRFSSYSDVREGDEVLGPQLPVTNITWFEANKFCRIWNKVNRNDEWRLALPSEMQWEFACRQKSETDYFNGDHFEALSVAGWFEENENSSTKPIGLKSANDLGIYDLHGNVCEWMAFDSFPSTYLARPHNCIEPNLYNEGLGAEERYVVRGGSWYDLSEKCRSSARTYLLGVDSYDSVGFRCVLVPGPGCDFNEDAASFLPNPSFPLLHRSSEMSMNPFPSEEELVVYLPDANLDADQLAQAMAAKPDCTTINLGKPGKELVLTKLTSLPKLSDKVLALRVWNAPNLTELPELPAGLELLDVRGCTSLTTVDLSHAKNLLLLDCGGCTGLHTVKTHPKAPLERLFLDGCVKLPAAMVVGFLKTHATLGEANLAGCALPANLGKVAAEKELWRLNLRDCTGLKTIERTGLGRCSALKTLILAGNKELTDPWGICGIRSLVTLDLRGIPATSFPENAVTDWPKLLSLYLDGCDFDNLPKQFMSQGEASVWRDVKAHLTESAKMVLNRCKVVVLGEGDAGKSCLVDALIDGRAKTDLELMAEGIERKSTHGIVFREWQVPKDLSSLEDPVHLHFWDFGGQHLYHKAHRLFMKTGTVFVVVWNATRYPREKRKVDKAGNVVDEPHTLQYWLDTILAQKGAKKARILLVRTKCDKDPSAEASEAWKERIDPALAACLVSLDLNTHQPKEAALDEIRKALVKMAEEEMGRQGQRTVGDSVEKAWKLVEDMLADNTAATRAEAPLPHKAFPEEAFQRKLLEEWARAGVECPSDSSQLQIHLAAVQRFLTNAGLIYELKVDSGTQIVVDQRWMLDAVYALFDREVSTPVLIKQRGHLLRSDLPRLGFGEYSEAEVELFLKVMKESGLVFEVGSRRMRWSDTQYIAPTFLPDRKNREGDIARWMDGFPADALASAPSGLSAAPLVSSEDFSDAFSDLGEELRGDALYYRNGMVLQPPELQAVAEVRFHPEEQACKGGIPVESHEFNPVSEYFGTVSIDVRGPQARLLGDRLDRFFRELATRAPGRGQLAELFRSDTIKRESEGMSVAPPVYPAKLKFAISFAGKAGTDPALIAWPVAIKEALQSDPRFTNCEVLFYMEKAALERLKDLREWMRTFNGQHHYFISVLSAPYLDSAYCVSESMWFFHKAKLFEAVGSGPSGSDSDLALCGEFLRLQGVGGHLAAKGVEIRENLKRTVAPEIVKIERDAAHPDPAQKKYETDRLTDEHPFGILLRNSTDTQLNKVLKAFDFRDPREVPASPVPKQALQALIDKIYQELQTRNQPLATARFPARDT